MASKETTAAQAALEQAEASKPGAYQSQYADTISNLMNQISNREAFSYDFNADPLYQQYKDQYTALGKQAANNAAASAATLTGGYANSYATTAAAQANQSYLTQLNNVIPELYEAAYDRYNTETENLYNQFNMYNTAENTAYSQYQDSVSNWQNDRDYYYNAYSNSVSNDQWRETQDTNNAQWAAEQQAAAEQAAASLAEQKREFNLDYKLDKQAQEFSQKQALKNSSSSSGSSSSSKKSSSKTSSSSTDTTDTTTTNKSSGNTTAKEVASYDKVTYKADTATFKKYLAIAQQKKKTTGDVKKYVDDLANNHKISEYQEYLLLRA